ncbi:MAG: hypothetical protein [Caudoviricetes sp.]|nr:MAG: hypothetical protein [Caudoviricetes sp.]
MLPRNKYSDVSDIDLLKIIVEKKGYVVSICNYTMNYCRCTDGTIFHAEDKLFYFELMIDNRMHVIPNRYHQKVDSWQAHGAPVFISSNNGKAEYPAAWSKSLCRAIGECYLLGEDFKAKG